MRPDTATVTASASVHVDSSATRNACRTCETYRPPDSKRWGGLHCTTCHGTDHGACVECGACLPAGHRYDRRYCSSSCRATAAKARQVDKLARAAWEAEHPEEAAKQEAEYQKWLETFKAVASSLDGCPSEQVKARRARHRDARRNAEACGDCQQPLDGTVYRRHNGSLGQDFGEAGAFVVPVCAACRCRNHAHHRVWLCERCRPGARSWDWIARTHIRRWSCPDAGPGHTERLGRYCEDCHPKTWRNPVPCEGCARPVSNHVAVRPGYRRGACIDLDDPTTAWVPDDTGHGYHDVPAADLVRTFCSERCRRGVFQDERRAKRQAERGDIETRCATCKAAFHPARADARYCSPGCRQRAYRRRKDPP